MTKPPSFCTNCGNTLKPTAKFCGSCGTEIEPLEIVKDVAYYWNMSDEEYIHQNPKLEKTIKWSDKNRPYLVGGALACFVLLILIWFA